ncbi:radical SAM protein [Caulobacter sp. BE254]|uniref:radical SAM protein n=1 Tax=Caulobacter sp. BE254 TaxID=2817720 RepID=UPI002864C869|nr:radical SAM protein [Caulobacter sp. BE254]MDR7114672.1 uncharacterized protein [Caulobacter sp. BE254]
MADGFGSEHSELSLHNQQTGVFCSHDASVEIVLKIQETCNINCRYCYMYNLGNSLHEIVPKAASIEVCLSVAKFIETEFMRRSPKYVRIVLHGGEPMLMPPHRFEERIVAIWSYLKGKIKDEDLKRVVFALQTNATLVSDKWIDVLSRWNITVGVSIDGPEEIHDQNRVDFSERGTHSRVVAGLRTLQAAGDAGRIKRPGVLCVIDPNADGEAVYKHIVRDLGVQSVDFLLPFLTWDRFDEKTVDGVTRFLLSAFQEWRRDGFGADIRIFQSAMSRLRRANGDASEGPIHVSHVVLLVESDGSISPEESLRETVDTRATARTIHTDRMVDILADWQFGGVIRSSLTRSKECDDCAILEACNSGGSLGRVGQRFQTGQMFNRKSVYCSTFVDLFIAAARVITRQGQDISALQSLFETDELTGFAAS